MLRGVHRGGVSPTPKWRAGGGASRETGLPAAEIWVLTATLEAFLGSGLWSPLAASPSAPLVAKDRLDGDQHNMRLMEA